MRQVYQTRVDFLDHAKNANARAALLREISCLKRQLQRLRQHQELATSFSIKTYQEMIRSRERMLGEL